jgi:hypothetical protein
MPYVRIDKKAPPETIPLVNPNWQLFSIVGNSDALLQSIAGRGIREGS